MNLPPCFTDPEAKRVLRQLCTEQQVDIELLQDLCSLMHEHTAKARIESMGDGGLRKAVEVMFGTTLLGETTDQLQLLYR